MILLSVAAMCLVAWMLKESHGAAWLREVWLATGSSEISLASLFFGWARPGKRQPVSPADRTSPALPTVGDRPEEAAVTTAELQVGEEDAVETMFAVGRYSLLLRPQIAIRLSAEQRQRARRIFIESMSLVPAGAVVLQPWQTDDASDRSIPLTDGLLVDVETFYLDRDPVTNEQFQRFVDSDGYQQKAHWSPAVWERVREFVDRSGQPGPCEWRSGAFPEGEADYPVVGISWFEAEAYARWVGKRLPTDAEWVKAACWPVAADGGEPVQRRYPWGDAMDNQKANLWSSGRGRTNPVTDFVEGTSVGGVRQLIGNVWEWTASNLSIMAANRPAKLDRPLKSIRGGAFDTYFDSQATCHSQSGDCPFARRHNIGFRCAISGCDVIDLFEVDSTDVDAGEISCEPDTETSA